MCLAGSLSQIEIKFVDCIPILLSWSFYVSLLKSADLIKDKIKD